MWIFKVILQIVIALRGDFNGCLNLEMKKKNTASFMWTHWKCINRKKLQIVCTWLRYSWKVIQVHTLYPRLTGWWNSGLFIFWRLRKFKSVKWKWFNPSFKIFERQHYSFPIFEKKNCFWIRNPMLLSRRTSS